MIQKTYPPSSKWLGKGLKSIDFILFILYIYQINRYNFFAQNVDAGPNGANKRVPGPRAKSLASTFGWMNVTYITSDRQSGHVAQRILVAAEHLFSLRGLNGVSMREIAVAAGNGNNNAVQYHFSSKEGLITAIHRYRVAQMELQRAPMLEAARAAGMESDLRKLVEIVCLPQLFFRSEEGRHTFAHFQLQYLTTHHSRGLLHPIDDDSGWTVTLREIFALTFQQLPGSEAIRRERIILANMIVLNAVVRWDNSRDEYSNVPEELLEDAMNGATAFLTAPAA